MRVLLRRLWNLLRWSRIEADLAEEMAFHREMKEHELAQGGTPAIDAASAARRALGSFALAQDQSRDVWTWSWLNGSIQDLRHAVRSLANKPGFTLIAVLTLALGISANTAIFSVSDALLLRPLPYPDSDRLVALRSSHSSSTPDSGLTSPLDLADWQARTTSFDAVAGYRWRTVDLTGGAYSQRLNGLWVTQDFFNVFGITRVQGRTFTPRDRGTTTIVLGRGIWERRFHADHALIGSMLDVNVINLSRGGATPHLVLGVVPVDVNFPPLTSDFNRGAVTSVAESAVEDRIDFWVPLFLGEDPRRDDRTLDVVAKCSIS